MKSPAQNWVASRRLPAGPGSREPSRQRVSAFRLRSLAQIMCRSPEALALGAAVISCRRRYHCPERGCLVNRSRDCTRSRVPPSFHAGVAITAPRRVPLHLPPLRSAPFGLSSRTRKTAALKPISQRICGITVADSESAGGLPRWVEDRRKGFRRPLRRAVLVSVSKLALRGRE